MGVDREYHNPCRVLLAGEVRQQQVKKSKESEAAQSAMGRSLVATEKSDRPRAEGNPVRKDNRDLRDSLRNQAMAGGDDKEMREGEGNDTELEDEMDSEEEEEEEVERGDTTESESDDPPYVQLRQANIRRNEERLRALGLMKLVSSPKKRQVQRKKQTAPKTKVTPRTSSRCAAAAVGRYEEQKRRQSPRTASRRSAAEVGRYDERGSGVGDVNEDGNDSSGDNPNYVHDDTDDGLEEAEVRAKIRSVNDGTVRRN
jgi:hypothetical protein